MTEPLVEISDARVDRFASLRLIAGWDQQRLETARVLVAGAGALGNEVLKNLALLGVHHVAVVDMDRVEASNLSRSVLFRGADAGRSKARAAARALRSLDPAARVIVLDGPLQERVGAGLLRRVDVVFGCLDNRAARIALNRLAARARVPWIDGSLDVGSGSVRTFLPPDGPCYECPLTDRDYALAMLRYSCPFVSPAMARVGRVPTTPTVASVVGALQVQAWLGSLHGDPPVAGRRTVFDAGNPGLRSFQDVRRDGCPGHRTFRTVTALPEAGCESTVGELARQVKPFLAGELTLRLDRPVVLRLDCLRCGAGEPMLRPEATLEPSEFACGACGAERLPRVTSRLPCGEVVHDVPLSRLGIPPLEVVLLQNGSGARGAFELAGDAERLLGSWADSDGHGDLVR